MKKISVVLLISMMFVSSCSKNEESETKIIEAKENKKSECCSGSMLTEATKCETDSNKNVEKAKITFVELGSVNCIPCKKMQPVMEAIEKKYGDQVKVVFYDVWKEDQKKYAEQYKIKLIPTQVFLDENGKEIFRHEGFFPEDEIDKLLQKHGLEVLEKGSSNG